MRATIYFLENIFYDNNKCVVLLDIHLYSDMFYNADSKFGSLSTDFLFSINCEQKTNKIFILFIIYCDISADRLLLLKQFFLNYN